MKAVMYHYVRPHGGGLPRLRYLPLDGFRRQLDYFERTCGFVSAEEFEASIEEGAPVTDGVVLTFDDGLADHVHYVLPELESRGLWAAFYVPTLPHSERCVLDVHKVHILLGRHSGERVWEVLQRLFDDSMLDARAVEKLSDRIYAHRVEDESVSRVKRTLNYFLLPEHRAEVCARLFAVLGEDEAAWVDAHYASADGVRALRDAGMAVGAHSVRHRLLSQLSDAEQQVEVQGSLDELSGILGDRVDTFCFPYGGDHSFDAHTLSLLRAAGVRYCFSVEPRDISPSDLPGRRLALPRYDCNAFPHGRAANVRGGGLVGQHSLVQDPTHTEPPRRAGDEPLPPSQNL